VLETALLQFYNTISGKYLTVISPNLQQQCVMDSYEQFTFGGQRVKVQGHSGIKRAWKHVDGVEAYSTQHLASS